MSSWLVACKVGFVEFYVEDGWGVLMRKSEQGMEVKASTFKLKWWELCNLKFPVILLDSLESF